MVSRSCKNNSLLFVLLIVLSHLGNFQLTILTNVVGIIYFLSLILLLHNKAMFCIGLACFRERVLFSLFRGILIPRYNRERVSFDLPRNFLMATVA